MSGITHAETDRLHAFDNVRGLAAVAVVALHASYAYARFPLAGLVWPVPLDEPSALANGVFWGIEGSVMPLFFTLSGFFLARSLAKQSPGRVLAGRTRRLLVPMTTVGLAVLAVDLHVWVLGLITTDRATIREYRRLKFAPEIQSDLFGPAHLWYIEYLWLLCVAICAAFWLRDRLRIADISRTDVWHRARTVCSFAALSAAAGALLAWAPQIVIGFQHGWLPDAAKLAHAAVFLLFGLLLQRSPWLIGITRDTPAYSAVAAVGLFAALLPRLSYMIQAEQTGIDIVSGSFLAMFAMAVTFGTLGVGLRWLDRPIALLSRLAAASLWIYLVHHPLVGLSQIAMRLVPLPPLLKCISVFAIAIALCLWTYERFASRGGLARLLEGEWPWRAFRAPVPSEAPAERPIRKAA
jgi:peptidoglycan/LPS O-acetylase OafA/YrhL